MKRRDFMKSASLVASTSLLTLQAMSKGDEIFGQNEKRYRLDKNWVKADISGLPVNDCHEMVQDGSGRKNCGLAITGEPA